MAVPGQLRLLLMLLVVCTAASAKTLESLAQDADPGNHKETQNTSAGPETSPSLASDGSRTSAQSATGPPLTAQSISASPFNLSLMENTPGYPKTAMALGAETSPSMVTVGGEKPISDLVTVVHGMKTTEKQQMLGSQEGSDTESLDREQGNQMVHEKKDRNEATTLKTYEPALAIWTTQNQISPNRSNQIRPNETTPATTDQFSRARADGTKQNETTPATVAQFSTTEASWTKQSQIGPTSAGQISPNEPTPATTDQFSVSKTNRTKQKETIPASTDWTKQKWTVSVSTSLTSLASTNPSMPASPPQTPPVPINEQRTPWTSPKAMPASQATTKNSVHSPMASGQSHHLGIIVAAVIIGILILVVLLIAALHYRRRHRSGSTSFNAGRAGPGEWAGPVMLPEEKGGGQAEDGGQEAKLDGSRRPTLTTFFGKRHSRVSSVAMEDMAGEKNESPLSEPLLATGEQQADPAPPGGVEANGTVPLTPGPPSPLPQPPANGEFPPPPPVEQDAMPPV